MAGAASAPLLYLVTDRRQTGGRPLEETVARALDGGVDAVQLREKDLGGADLVFLAERLRTLTQRYRARLLVNDRVDVALAVDADGVHLPRDGMPPAVARELLGPSRMVGASVHSRAEAEDAAAGGVDFLVFGPVYFTASKAGFGSPRGLEELRGLAATLPVPVLAIGGITAARTGEVLRAGAAGIAVLSAIVAAQDPAAAAREISSALRAEAR